MSKGIPILDFYPVSLLTSEDEPAYDLQVPRYLIISYVSCLIETKDSP